MNNQILGVKEKSQSEHIETCAERESHFIFLPPTFVHVRVREKKTKKPRFLFGSCSGRRSM